MNWAWHFGSLELRRLISYRMDFWAKLLGSIVSVVGVSYFLWLSIFQSRGVTEIGGYTFGQMMVYYGLVTWFLPLLYGSEKSGISFEIYDGSLTRYLVYPIPYLGYRLVLKLAFSLVSLVQYGAALAVLLIFLPSARDAAPEIGPLALGAAFALIAGILYFTAAAILELVAFWADNVWSLLVMLRFTAALLSGAFIPLEIFPETLRAWIDWLPFPYLLHFPIQIALGKATLAEGAKAIAVLGAWELVLCAVLAWEWARGTRRYTGVGI